MSQIHEVFLSEHTDLSKDRGPHIDVNNDKKCDVCGYALHSSSSHVHTFDEEHWETTDTHHWHKATCEHTDLSSNLGEHIFGSNNVCTICSFKKDKIVKIYNYFILKYLCLIKEKQK